ncbi:MAG: GNAT family N-acetyltransferase [Gaiella sp.]
MIRELAENPNVHQPLSAGRELVHDPRGRFALYLAPGVDPHAATVQRVRVDRGGVQALVDDVRALLRERGREGAEWELGQSCTPSDLVELLIAQGLRQDDAEPVAVGMVLRGVPAWDRPAGVETRSVRDLDDLRAARAVQQEAFDDPRPADEAQLELDLAREGLDGSTHLALLDGDVVGAAYAAYTPWGVILFGGATLERARGRGVYRALVAARAREAEARGTPVLVTHAGRLSHPILARLGFEPVARIDRLLDVLGG